MNRFDRATPQVHEVNALTGDAEGLELLNRYWDAANYLTVAQIYLQENVLLRVPLAAEHIKPRLLGHWGTSPGLSLIYVHLNRLIRRSGAQVLFVAGPGHGGPAVIANLYLEGTYSEIYPDVSRDLAGLRNLVRQFSTRAASPATWGRPPRVPSTRAGSWAIRWPTPRVPQWTTLSSSWPA